MWLSSIKISNFRNFARGEINPHKGLNFLCGHNGAGKTNFLEAIGVLSHGKSMRLKNNDDLILENSEVAFLEGCFIDDKRVKIKVTCSIERGRGKKIRVNEKTVAKLSDVFCLVPTVQCFEEDSNLLHGPPSARRVFIDKLCAQIFPDYIKRHQEFREALSNRNALLRSGKLIGKLRDASNVIYARKAAPIMAFRQKALSDLAIILNDIKDIFEEDVELNITQKDLSQERDSQNYIDTILDKLRKSRREEEKYFRTSVGPHRDSFEFSLANKKIRWRSSRGQIKNMILRIKASEYFYLKERLKRTPIILLDDVFAEMDELRSRNLVGILKLGTQVFCASTKTIKTEVFDSLNTMLEIEIKDGCIIASKEKLNAA